MKEFIEKLIGRLEDGIFSMDERMKYNVKTQKHLISQNQGIRYAINSINQLAEEYINTSTDTSSDTSTINADRIRSMADEELAEFLINYKNTFGEEYEGKMSCLDWLKSEAQEEGE